MERVDRLLTKCGRDHQAKLHYHRLVKPFRLAELIVLLGHLGLAKQNMAQFSVLQQYL